MQREAVELVGTAGLHSGEQVAAKEAADALLGPRTRAAKELKGLERRQAEAAAAASAAQLQAAKLRVQLKAAEAAAAAGGNDQEQLQRQLAQADKEAGRRRCVGPASVQACAASQRYDVLPSEPGGLTAAPPLQGGPGCSSRSPEGV